MTCATLKKLKIGIAVAYLMAFGFVFSYDVPLHPELIRLREGLPKVDAAQNRYFAMLGFSAPAGKDMLQVGMEKVAALRTQLAAGQEDDTPVPVSKELLVKGEMPKLYDKAGNDMRSFVAKNPERVTALLADNRELVQRYLALRQYPELAEPLDLGFRMPIPQFGPLREAQRLEQLRLMQSGGVAETLEFVQADLTFWRNDCRQARTLINKLVAIACIGRDYEFISAFASGKALTESEWQKFEALLATQTHADVEMSRAITGELLAMGASLAEIRKGPEPTNPGKRLFYRLFLKPGLTSNANYENFQADLQRAQLSAPDFALAYEASNRQDHNEKIGKSLLSALTNPIGQYLNLQSLAFTQYLERPHRLEGQRRLALLKLRIARQKISDSGISAFLATAGHELANPFTGMPMGWDAANRKLFFDKLNKDEGTVDCYL